MVKVVGVAPEAVKQVTCRNCASILEYTKSEVKECYGRDYSGCSDCREWIVCPSCGKEVILRSW